MTMTLDGPPRFSPPRSPLIARLWNGEVSLGATYWLYGFLGGVVIRLLFPLIAYLEAANYDSLSKSVANDIAVLWFMMVTSYSVFTAVAIWRSATNYRIQKPAKRVNAVLAKTAVVFGLLGLFKGASDFVTQFTLLNTSDNNVMIQLEATVAGLNSTMPKKLDSLSTMTKVSFEANSFVYNIYLSVKINDVVAFNDSMRQKLKSLCNNTETIPSLRAGVNMVYVYSDVDTANVTKVMISKADCPNL